jgi:DNA gyrase subunit A
LNSTDYFAISITGLNRNNTTNFSRPRKGGIIAIELRDGDKLVGVDITSGENDIKIEIINSTA